VTSTGLAQLFIYVLIQQSNSQIKSEKQEREKYTHPQNMTTYTTTTATYKLLQSQQQ
jgi:hypothetical protein